MLNFKTLIVKFKRSDKSRAITSFENAIDARMVFRTKDIEVAYVEFIEGNFEPTEIMQVLTPQEAYDLACAVGEKDRVKLVDGVLYFKKYRRGGRIGRNGVKYQNKRKAYRVNPE